MTGKLGNSWIQIYPKQIAKSDKCSFSATKHPQQWTKHEVGVWLKWCSEEYCIDCIPPDKLDMNGKALCLLGREDFIARVPKNGDILYNALQKLIQRSSGNVVCSPVPPYSNFATTSTGSYTTSPFKSKLVDNLSNGGLIVFSSASTPTSTPYSAQKISTRPLIPILPQPSSKAQSEINLTTVSSVSGVLSPAPSIADTDDASEDGSVTDPDEPERRQEETSPSDNMNYQYVPTVCPSLQTTDQSHLQMMRKDSDCRLLWEFIHQLLLNPQRYSNFVCWENPQEYVFRIIHPTGLAQLWGHQKNRTNMTYEKLSRALRYYYRMNIIKKVSGRRLTYQFLQPPSNIQKGQRGAKPHSKTGPSTVEKVQNDCSLEENIPDDDSKHSESSFSLQEPMKLEYPLVDNLLNDNSFDDRLISSGFKTSRSDASFDKRPVLDQVNGHEDVQNGCLSPTPGSNRTSPFSCNPSPLHIKPDVDLQTEPQDLSMATLNKRKHSQSEEINDHEDDFQIKRENGNRFPVKVEFKNISGCS